ncbi:MAG: TIR domain-containing protein, partial [Gammaproteobacteria bacterium]|nr:TIR domain-containing protein [Gammaproteobacteria bacterium]
MSVLSESGSCRYGAYISYSHRDEEYAVWLHKKLEAYRVPRRLVGSKTAFGVIPRRLAPIFRDREELPSATDLGETVNKALRDSANLIVICSPYAAASRWVNEEILTFKRLGRSDRIFCFIIDGEPNTSDMLDRADEECFPVGLRFRVNSDGDLTDEPTEPIAADAREGKDGKIAAKLKLIAGIVGVGFDELRRRELHRRHYRMATVTAVALSVMVLATGLAIRAMVAERDALEHRAQAESLIGFMLGDVRDKLKPAGRLDALDAVGDKAVEYFDALDEHSLTPETLEIRSKAMRQIGEVRMAQGRLDQAMGAFQRSLSDAELLLENDPDYNDARFLLGQAQFGIAYVHMEQGDLDRTQRYLQAYLDTSRDLVERQPQNEKWLQELGYAYTNLGTVFYSHGEATKALEQFQGGQTIAEALLALNPDDLNLRFDLAGATSWVGSALKASGDLGGAREQFREEVAIKNRLVAVDSQNTLWKRHLSLGHRRVGEILEAQGKIDEALNSFRTGLRISEELVLLDPSNTNWQQDNALLHAATGRIALTTGGVQEALASFARHNGIFQALITEDAGKARWQKDLANGLMLTGNAFKSMGDLQEAGSAANEAVSILSGFLSEHPEDREATRLLSEAYLLQEDWREALELIEPLARGSKDYRILYVQLRALLHLDQVEEAERVVEQLTATGFANPVFVELCERNGLLA